MPVVVVWGANDRWIPVNQAHRLADAIPDAQVTVIDDAGHLVQLDQPAQLGVILTNWIMNQPGR